mmetsp:Transcript_4493/g.11584  ORF Transcript_4493/g.11584 Transcript_4493/m.11584 type:complete len:328 (+) Transcript_4493:46-1029(+)
MQLKDLQRFLEILNEPVLFGDLKDDEGTCKLLLLEFKETEIEELANVSYAYWIINSKATDKVPPNARQTSALKEIRRHYIGEGRNYKRALSSIREALQYRREYRFDIIRSCFYDSQHHKDNDIEEDEDVKLAKTYSDFIIDDLRRQPMIVCGFDDNDRSIVYKPPRKSSDRDNPDAEKAFLLTQIYTAERAIATSDFRTKGKEDRHTVIFDFKDYDQNNTPGSSATITMVKVLQRCYPERLGVLIIASPSFWVKAAVSIVRVFLVKQIAERIRLPANQSAVNEEYKKILSGNAKLKDALEKGEISSFSLTNYTEHPFYSLFQHNNDN